MAKGATNRTQQLEVNKLREKIRKLETIVQQQDIVLGQQNVMMQSQHTVNKRIVARMQNLPNC